MVCTANDLLEWKDFPKGLRVLLLDEDTDSAAEIKSKLEEMEYIVSAFFSEDEALSAISSKNEFHVAILEVSMHNSDGRYKFLEASKDLPTIMMSNEQCLNTMMKCIALGAVEFLIKPLSEDKLRHIWQHVVHKAFNAGGTESLKSVKEFVGSVLEFQQKNIVITQNQVSDEEPNHVETDPNDEEEQAICDKFPAPSTPQLKHGGRFLDDGDYQEQTSGSPLKESGEVDGETKSVDTTTNGNSATQMEVDPPQPIVETNGVKEESESSKEDKLLSKSQDEVNGVNSGVSTENSKKESVAAKNSCGVKGSSRKKAKVDWTPELHKKFVQAVEQLGVDQAIPSRILELMKVEGLTRHNVASHLQKYRMQKRHILPKTEVRRWPHPRDSTAQRNYYPYKPPVMAFPSYLAANNTTTTVAPAGGMQMQAYPVWGQQSGAGPPGHGFPTWGAPPPGYPWQLAPEAWHWNGPYAAPGMHADAWGCPVLPHPTCAPTFPQVQGGHGFHSRDNSYGNSPCDQHPGEEVIDKAVKEAISKPWLPLPLGLKPPSTDSVLAELSRQGISTVPPPHHKINGRGHR